MANFDNEQMKAINHINGPFLCIAGPGSGKTTVVVNRTMNLIKNGVNPKSILTVTFTKDAANEMGKRYAALPGAVEGPIFSTIHSFAFNVCRSQYAFDASNILKGVDHMKFIKNYLTENGKKMTFNDINSIAGYLMNEVSKFRFMSAEDQRNFSSDIMNQKDFIEFYKAYFNFKTSSRKIDFDDMLDLCRKAFTVPEILNMYQEQYKYIMIDEFQDTSLIQAEILYKLAEKYKNIFICGDDDQSIYGFRNARPDIMLNFKQDFPDADSVRLSVNYRSDSSIITAAGNLIGNNNVRFEKDIKGNSKNKGTMNTIVSVNEKEQFRKIISCITENHASGTAYKDMAILCRTNVEMSFFAKKLSDNDIPFNSKDSLENFHDTWLFKTIMSYICIAYNKETRYDIMNIANKPSRYLKRDLIEKSKGDISVMKSIAKYDKRQLHGVNTLEWAIKDIRRFARDEDEKFSDVVKYICMCVNIESYITDYCEYAKIDSEIYFGIYDEIIMEAEDFDAFVDYELYIRRTDTSFSEKSNNRDPEGVMVSTMHSSKGLEWDIVYIPSCNYGNIPKVRQGEELDKKSEEEERRLFYVAITRAKKECFVSYINDSENEYGFVEEIKKAAEKEKHKTQVRSSSYKTIFSEFTEFENRQKAKKEKAENAKDSRKVFKADAEFNGKVKEASESIHTDNGYSNECPFKNIDEVLAYMDAS